MKLKPKKYLKTREMYDEDYMLTTDSSGAYSNLQPGDSAHEEIGIIAQDLEQIDELKFCVHTPSDNDSRGSYSVAYNDLFVFHIKATQELAALVQAQATTIAALELRVAALEG